MMNALGKSENCYTESSSEEGRRSLLPSSKTQFRRPSFDIASREQEIEAALKQYASFIIDAYIHKQMQNEQDYAARKEKESGHILSRINKRAG